MTILHFRDRLDAAKQLAAKLKELDLEDPLVLGIPRGGVVTAAVLADELHAELDVVLARKLRHPAQPELAIGAVSEEGEVHMDRRFPGDVIDQAYVHRERDRQLAELKHRRELFRSVRPAAKLAGRSVIVTDDGIATGSTMIAALHVVQKSGPRDTTLAVPVSAPGSFSRLAPMCDHALCLSIPQTFGAISQYYDHFDQVSDDEVCDR
ncbi:MAG: phosphoribosyltransferase family protein, partial [Planctomycetota bacterium]